MKFLKIWINFLFFLLIIALPTSMALMELATWLMFLSAVILVFVPVTGLVKPKWHLFKDKNIDVFLLLFVFASIFVTLVNFNLSWDQKIECVKELRWILPLYSYSYLIRMFEPQKNKKLLYAFLSLVLIGVIYSFIQAFVGWDLVRADSNYGGTWVNGVELWRSKGFFSNTMTFSYIYGMYFSFLTAHFMGRVELGAKTAKDFFIYFIFVLMGVTLLLTQTRGMWIAVFVMLCTLIYLKFPKRAKIILASFFVILGLSIWQIPFLNHKVKTVFVLDGSNESNFHRINIWKANIQMIKENPILGIGYRRNADELQNYYEKMGIEDSFVGHAHNVYLQVFAGSGVVVFSLYMLFAISLFRLSVLMYREGQSLWILGGVGAQVVYHVGALTENVFMDGEIWYNCLFMISLLGVMSWQSTKDKKLYS